MVPPWLRFHTPLIEPDRRIPASGSRTRENAKSDATLYNYGIILKALNRPAKALERFTGALAINQATAETWNNRGTVFYDLKRPDEAIWDFDKAIQILPRYAKTLARLRRLDESLSAFEAATELRSNFWEAWLGPGKARYELKSPEEALACYVRAQELKPSHPDAWFTAGNALSELKRHHEAIYAYVKTVAIQPRHAAAHSNCGELAEHETSINDPNDIAIRRAFEAAGVEFIEENRGGAGVRLRKR